LQFPKLVFGKLLVIVTRVRNAICAALSGKPKTILRSQCLFYLVLRQLQSISIQNRKIVYKSYLFIYLSLHTLYLIAYGFLKEKEFYTESLKFYFNFKIL